MTLATRCPTCGTTFKVVSDQLKLQRGLVKCGSCGQVFDGIEHLRYVNKKAVSAQTTSEPELSSPEALLIPPHSHQAQQESKADDDKTDVDEKLENDVTAPEPVAKQLGLLKFMRPAGAKFLVLAKRAKSEKKIISSELHHSPATEAEIRLPGFMLPNKRASFAIRLLWSLLLLLSLFLLALQITYRYRHEIAAYAEPHAPGIPSVITQACQLIPIPVDCAIKLPRHIEDIRVSAAEVIETNTPDLYSLRFSLRNESNLPLAYPALNMTLSDARNRIVARKVVFPEEYLTGLQGSNSATATLSSQGLSKQGEQSFILPIKIESGDNSSSPIKVVGYLVEIFYP
jgi:predicted Zn finger-like uncharacterized protein